MTTHDPSTFPRHLLTAPNSERLAYFRTFTIKHPLLLRAYEELWCAIRDSNPGSIIFIYGPTGVGKTTLLERMEKQFKEKFLPELKKDCERIPIVKVHLAAPTTGIFDWKDYFQRLLLKLEEPLIDHKLDRSRWEQQSQHTLFNAESNMQLISSDKPGIRPLRFASERTLQHRRPVAVLIDDAQHFGIINSGRKLLDQLNTIKSLADDSKVTHALCGTYELIPLRNLNGQLSRRSIDIHFGRYHASNEKHRQEFINILYTFQQHLPLSDTPDLVSRWDYFYERSLGCIGVLKDWLTLSLALALDSSCQTITLEYLQKHARSVHQCTTMLRETKLSEKELQEEEEGALLLRQDLGLTIELASDNCGSTSHNSEKRFVAKPAGRKRRVGVRKPVRDKIGIKTA
jgi:energy-coupling factor transporter ATP-binding protein EcfA2